MIIDQLLYLCNLEYRIKRMLMAIHDGVSVSLVDHNKQDKQASKIQHTVKGATCITSAAIGFLPVRALYSVKNFSNACTCPILSSYILFSQFKLLFPLHIPTQSILKGRGDFYIL